MKLFTVIREVYQSWGTEVVFNSASKWKELQRVIFVLVFYWASF